MHLQNANLESHEWIFEFAKSALHFKKRTQTELNFSKLAFDYSTLRSSNHTTYQNTKRHFESAILKHSEVNLKRQDVVSTQL